MWGTAGEGISLGGRKGREGGLTVHGCTDARSDATNLGRGRGRETADALCVCGSWGEGQVLVAVKGGEEGGG